MDDVELDDELAEIWAVSKPTMLARCDTVLASATTDDRALVEAARADSHRLAGSVGMFGFVEAGALAQQVDALVSDGALADERRSEVARLVGALADAIREDR